MNKTLILAGIAGIFSLFFTVNIYLQIIPTTEPTLYLVLLCVSVLAYIAYLAGFVALGDKFKNKHLQYVTYVWIACAFLSMLLYLVPEDDVINMLLSAISSIQSTAIIILGWIMLQLVNRIGPLAVFYGACAMLVGSTLPFMFGTLAGLVVDLLCYVFAVLIFFRVAEKSPKETSS